MSWPAVKRNYTWEEFRRRVSVLSWTAWRPSLIVLHNTAAPTLAQWKETAAKDVAAGLVPGTTRIGNLEKYFRDDNHWSGCPHLFIADDFIWEMNRLTDPGVHSPSWNHLAIGIEMIADFDREDDDSGPGLVVRRSTVFATAVLCSALGLDPRAAVKLHKEDPKTTHACPGIDFARDRSQVITEIEQLLPGGDYHGVPDAPTPAPAIEFVGTVLEDGLNVRRGPGVLNASIGTLPNKLKVSVIGYAVNGETRWLKIRTPFGVVGWVAGQYVNVNLKEN